ncbi:hypothetical protein C8039_15660 [Halogeometricum sp. wsp3]|nr:hypothetical protein C8039_15660 [Halogeometricum sp. wsp3]
MLAERLYQPAEGATLRESQHIRRAFRNGPLVVLVKRVISFAEHTPVQEIVRSDRSSEHVSGAVTADCLS